MYEWKLTKGHRIQNSFMMLNHDKQNWMLNILSVQKIIWMYNCILFSFPHKKSGFQKKHLQYNTMYLIHLFCKIEKRNVTTYCKLLTMSIVNVCFIAQILRNGYPSMENYYRVFIKEGQKVKAYFQLKYAFWGVQWGSS